jgi:outer membrane protein assembly factor BamD (BamD/ComL family)/TM2 domain-containing membrane protein YozV
MKISLISSLIHFLLCSQDRISRHRWIALLLLGAVILLSALPSLSAEVPPLLDNRKTSEGFSADQLIEFADHLLHEGEYFRAITEYRRFLFYYSQDQRQIIVHFRIGLALYRGQQYEQALRTFHEIAQQYPDTPYGKQAWLWQGECLLRQAQYKAAEQFYTLMLEQFSDDEIGQLAHYQRGWAFLYQRKWQEASHQFQQITPESSLYHIAHRLAEEALLGGQVPSKSPLVAGILSSVLPGSGQLYNGRQGDALLAFFLNGLSIVGIVQAITHGELAIAGVLSFFEAGWYAGSIYSAINGAHKYNRRTEENFLRNLENRYRLRPQESKQQQIYSFQLGFTF